ncbi:MAG: transcription-repair coupling factor [Myxococcota bacterium]
MEATHPAHHAGILAGLARANAEVGDAVRALVGHERVDLTGLPPGAAAYVLDRAIRADAGPVVVVTPDLEGARRTAADLAFFGGGGTDAEDEAARRGDVLLYPSSDVTPFLEVAPDRRAAMDRLAVLFHLSQGLPWRALVLPAPALLRRVPPRDAIARRSLLVEAEGELDRESFIRILVEGGYLRVPVAEDPGTFAVRGGILDVFPPHARYPARIELDDYLVLSIKLFDPEDQRTVDTVERIFVHPVRDALLGENEVRLAKDRVRALCDEFNWPTTKTRQLVEDLESGRTFLGLDGFLPAFYPELATVLDYAADARVVLLDPATIVRSAEEELGRARADRGAKVEDGAPVYPVESHYMDEAEAFERLTSRPLARVHRLAVAGEAGPDDHDSALGDLDVIADPDAVLHLGGEDQTALAGQLKALRGRRDGADALGPVADRSRQWLDEGVRLLLSARTQSQADRLATLLRGYDLPVNKPAPFDPDSLTQPAPGRVEVVIGQLARGFVLPSAGLACLTEEEIFGSRVHRRAARRRRAERTDRMRPFLEDLRELTPGDYVVHIDHGIGRYLGLERKAIPQSASERMRGDEPHELEVLVVEYGTGERLFLPVTRLNQIQKYAGKEGQKPKLDKLGGQTFAKTKAKVQKHVRKLADELLRLYAERAASTRDPLGEADRAFAEFEATFPFEETPDQAKAIDEVLHDLEAPHPMDRLVCGDVGFGKTEVALRAAFRVATGGRQVGMLCPTTVLAQQHYLTFQERFGDWPLNVEVLSRFVDRAEQTRILAGLKDGTIDVVIGTHRLLSKDVHFKDLGLLVVDEEQRFGVTHKERIKQLRARVDVLTLSATPIPRTLQMAVGGLRDLSLITTAPVDRRAVRTLVCRWDDQVIREAIGRELTRGGQVFFVYNRIEGLYERAQKLQQLAPDARIAVAHGQMKEGGLERIMTDFVDGRYDILCSTAIIESGLDIPRANTMIIDRADMFGLAQLYQLRGRVGRSRERAYCYLVTPPPQRMTDEARFRIEALERFTQLGSGFHVASLDMELRGAGDLLGAEQSGSVASVGLELFVHMLEEAVSQLRGEPVVQEVDPELNLDVEHFLPEDYIEDVGLRLSFYKRFASAEDAGAIEELAAEMEDRFGSPPPPARQFVRAMHLKPGLREFRVLGCDASARRVMLHLEQDTPLDPAKVMERVGQPRSPWKLSPAMKLSRRFEEGEGDAIDHVHQVLQELAPLRK